MKVRDARGKIGICGSLCKRTDDRYKGECRCNEHKRKEETDTKSAWEDMRLVLPKEDLTEVPRETRLTSEEERILKQAYDITEKKKEESRRLSEQWTGQESQPMRN